MICFIRAPGLIHQIFSLARDWSKHVTFSRQMEAFVYLYQGEGRGRSCNWNMF